MAVFMALPGLLREFGQDPQSVLAAVGLTPGLLAKPDTFVPFEKVDKLLQHCREVTGCEHFGLLAGQKVSLSYLGALGFAMKSAENVATALANLSRYRVLHDQSALITLEHRGKLVYLRYLVTQSAVTAPDQVYDYAVAVGCSLLRELCGPAWKPSRLMLRRERPVEVAPYDKFYRCPIIFDSDWAGMEFQSRWLNIAPAGADPMLYRHMLREIRELDHAAVDVGADPISSLRLLLATQHCNQGEAAALLGINTRTLRRQLMSAGTTFRAELETAKFARARAMLEVSGLSALEIADKLGYADLSAFSHAFKRWSGVSPAHWRGSAKSEV
ncbi:MAG: AraC family transcriptional regulator [Halieaceae bacterium]|jgi:AraC-like DNA-binding protein|nr:AraC family transcriptional regulator [Halieaceae bacterium]